jgi:hypothetical protein
MRPSAAFPSWIPILFLLALAPSLRAQGGPPFLTDDPGTPGDGHWEINTAWLHESRGSGHTDELPLLDLNYGVGDRLQLKYEASELLVREDGEPVRSGFSNSLAGVKWRFYDDTKSATLPQLEFSNPGSGSARRGLTADETTLILPVEVVKELGHGLAVNFETGYVSSGRSDSSWFYGVVLGGEVGEKTELGIELHGECSADGARSELATVLGLRYKVTDHSVILVSAGRELHNHLEPRASLLSYLGWQILH